MSVASLTPQPLYFRRKEPLDKGLYVLQRPPGEKNVFYSCRESNLDSPVAPHVA
jgi:hypothetical protein